MIGALLLSHKYVIKSIIKVAHIVQIFDWHALLIHQKILMKIDRRASLNDANNDKSISRSQKYEPQLKNMRKPNVKVAAFG